MEMMSYILSNLGCVWVEPILKMVDLIHSEFAFDSQVPKAAGFAGLEGLVNLLLQKVAVW